MDVGTPIREIEVIPEHKPVPVKDPDKQPVPTPKEREIAVRSIHQSAGVLEKS